MHKRWGNLTNFQSNLSVNRAHHDGGPIIVTILLFRRTIRLQMKTILLYPSVGKSRSLYNQCHTKPSPPVHIIVEKSMVETSGGLETKTRIKVDNFH